MDLFELLQTGVSFEKVEKIIKTRRPAQELMARGLSAKTIKGFEKGPQSYVYKGTTHKPKVGDLRGPHFTEKKRSLKYTLSDPGEVRYQASRHLDQRRGEMMTRLSKNRSRKHPKKRSKKGKTLPSAIPMPGDETDKQVTVGHVPRNLSKHKPSSLCYAAARNDAESELAIELEKRMEEVESEAETRKPKAALFTNAEEMDAYWNRLNDIDSDKIPKDNTLVIEANKRWEVAMTSNEDSKKIAKSGQEKAVTFAAPVVTGRHYYDAGEDGSEEVDSEAALFVNNFRYHSAEEEKSQEDEFEDYVSRLGATDFIIEDFDEDEFEADESGMAATEVTKEDPDEDQSEEDKAGVKASECTIGEPDEHESTNVIIEDPDEDQSTNLTIEDPDDIEMESAKIFKGDPSALYFPNLPVSNVTSGKKSENISKRKRDEVSPESTPLDDVDHSERRKKLKTVSSSPHVLAGANRSNMGACNKGKPSLHHLFCRSSSLAAVFRTAIEMGATEIAKEGSTSTAELNSTPQDNDFDAYEMDDIESMLLGEDPSDSEHASPSNDQDLEMVIAEALWPEVSHIDICIARAGANLIKGNLSSSELGSRDREALKEAFGGEEDGLQLSSRAGRQDT